MAPPTIPNWANNGTYSRGPDGPANPSGAQPTQVAPSSGNIADGFTPGDGFVASWANWLIQQFKNLFTHLFTYAYNATTQEHTYETPIVRTLGIEPSSAAIRWEGQTYGANLPWIPATNTYPGGIRSVIALSQIYIPIHLPVGCVITRIDFVSPPGGCYENNSLAFINRCQFWLTETITNVVSGNQPTQNIIQGTNWNGTGQNSTYILDTGDTFGPGSVGGSDTYFLPSPGTSGYLVVGNPIGLLVQARSSGGMPDPAGAPDTYDEICAIQITFTDPGPRNGGV